MLCVLAIFATVLTQLKDLASLVQARPSECHAEFCITGTVSYVLTFQEHFRHLILQEDDVGVDISGTIISGPPLPGDVICLAGIAKRLPQGDIVPEFRSFAVLGRGKAPSPATGTAAEIMSGRHDLILSVIDGEVRDVRPSGTNSHWNFLSLISDGNLYYVPIPTRGATLSQLKKLIGSTVRLRGYPDPHNGSYRFLEERRFIVAGLNEITVLRDPSVDPFAHAPSVDTLHRLPAEKISQLGRHKTSGHVLTVWNRRHALLLMPDERRALVTFDIGEDKTAPIPARGDSIEVCGYPATDGFTLNLTHSIARRLAGPPFTEPTVVMLTEKDFRDWFELKGRPKSRMQGQRFQLCGTVGELSDEQRRRGILPLLIDSHLLEVDFSSVPDAVRSVEAGCRVRITGTCVLTSESWMSLSDGALLNGIRIVLDRPDDLEILARPPWWTPARLTALVAVLALAVIAFYLWNVSLRRLSEKRGRALLHERTANALAELKTVERTRLAVELHDSISQILTGAAMQLDAGETNAAKRILASCRRELRSCLWELRSNALDAATLADAVRETIAPHLGDRKAAIDIDIPSSALSEELRHAALRIVREATVNAIRHGRATTVAISGELTGKRLTLVIIDNGRGFDPSVSQGSATGHFGLLGMRERAKAFNGSVSIVSAPGSGTEVTVVLEDRSGYDFGEDTADKDATST